MKISKLTNGLLVSLLLSASAVEADSKYPATDFQPKVVYQDSDYKHSGSTKSTSSSKAAAEVSVADPNFPAANFKPEVLYQDKDYKHTKGSVKKNFTTAAVTSIVEEKNEEIEQAEDSSVSLILGVLVLAVAAFVFKNKSTKKTAPVRKAAPARRVASTGGDSVSGVAKYLEGKNGVKPSGVAKYLEDRDSSPVSGVSKYVAKKKVSARLASVTGVEKYLKDRG